MAERGSAGNVIAAICSFFIPGLGQIVQGRILAAIIFFIMGVLAGFLYSTWVLAPLGFILHVWAILDAALYKRG